MHLPLMSRLSDKTSSGETILEVYQLTVDGPSFLNGDVTIGTSLSNANTIMNGNLLVTGTISGGFVGGVTAVTASTPINSTGGAVPNISILPGSNGQVLTTVSGIPTWTTPGTGGTVTSVSASVPSFLTVTGSPITTVGTLAIAYNTGTALPYANGGTGLTTAGSNGQVLTTVLGVPAWATPAVPVTSVTASAPLASSGTSTPNITIPNQTGTGTTVVLDTSPTIVTPIINRINPSSNFLIRVPTAADSATFSGFNAVLGLNAGGLGGFALSAKTSATAATMTGAVTLSGALTLDNLTGGTGNLSVTGTTTLSALTASTALALNASNQIISVTNTGTGNNVLATSPTLIAPLKQTLTSTAIPYAITLTLTAAQFAGGLIRVTGASASCTMTTDTAANLATQFGSTPNTAVRIRFSYTSTGANRVMNFSGGSGVTIYDGRTSNQSVTSIIEIVIVSGAAADVYIN